MGGNAERVDEEVIDREGKDWVGDLWGYGKCSQPSGHYHEAKKKSPSPCEAGHLPQGQQSALGFGNSSVDLTDFPL